MKKVICIILIVALCAIGSVFAFRYYQRHVHMRNLLECVGVKADFKCKMLAYDYWKDPLAYVNGYEVAVFEFDAEKWITPENWYVRQIGINDIEPIIEFEIRESATTELGVALPDHFDECFFRECGREGEFKNWEFYIGLYSADGLLVVYRGHDLNSDIWKHL